MQYIHPSDLAYLETKYHPGDAAASLPEYNRFICHDLHYDMSTGLDDKSMTDALRAFVDALPDTDHAMIKAKAFRFILEHTPIDVNEHDYFVGIHSMSRVIGRVLNSKWHGELFGKIVPEVGATLAPLQRDGALTGWPDYDHSVPDWDYMFPLGFSGLLREAKAARDRYLAEQGEMSPEVEAYYTSIFIELEAVLMLLDRFIDFAKAHPNAKTPTVLPALESLRNGAPTSTLELLLFICIYFILSEHIEGLQVRSLSNLDWIG